MNNEPVVIADRLTKRYGEHTALDNLSLTVERGQILGFIGPNGAGKTTTISILVGLSKPTSGSARIAGADCVRDTQQIKRLIGYMPDTFGTYDNMRVREYLDFFGAAYGIPRRDRRARIAAVLELTNATWMQDRFVDALSHGMKQRVGIARTLLHDPQVLILDEPANGLDPVARIEMRTLLEQLSDAGKTLIVTSHILPELGRICDVVAMITNGVLRAFGTVDEIVAKVHPERMMELQLANAAGLGDAAAMARRFVENAASVSTSESERVVRFRTNRTDDELTELLAQLIGAKIRVAQFREVPMDLEDAFLSVAGHTGADTGRADSLGRSAPTPDHQVAGGASR
ncbi:MAG: ABC transporter ATP-binding protein [Planctomycetaceae bacterium]|nr:ABC transporter ATP-binding protein [Planctomycetaceae bacterium]